MTAVKIFYEMRLRRVGQSRRWWLVGVKEVLLGCSQRVQEAVLLTCNGDEGRTFVMGVMSGIGESKTTLWRLEGRTY